jgi:predicted secreted protein
VFAAAAALSNQHAFAKLIRDHAALAAFLLLYALVYVPAIGFYAPTSGTGTTRFFLAHVAPLLFVLSMFLVRAPFSETRWTIGGVAVAPAHFHMLIIATVLCDVAFTLWTRVMTTYGGF